MTYKEIQDLIKLITKEEISELKLKDGDFEITVRSKDYSKNTVTTQHISAAPAMMPSMPAPVAQEATPVAPAASSPSGDSGGSDDSTQNLLEVRSPIVGTFYRSSSPDKPPFVLSLIHI